MNDTPPGGTDLTGPVLFIGLGRMGAPMVQRLTAAHPVLVHDADPEAVARVAQLPGAEAVADLRRPPQDLGAVILMLPNSAIVESVLLGTTAESGSGLLGSLRPGVRIIDMSSSEPESTQRLHALAKAAGIDYVDAPVSGGVARAETGELSIMVGAEDDALVAVRPLLERMGSAIVHVGGPGSGHAAKAINNILSASNLVSAAEALLTAERFGIARETMLDVINHSTARSQASEVKFPRHIETGAYDSGFYFSLMLKDIGIASTLIERYGLSAPNLLEAKRSAEAAFELFGDAGVSGGPLDHTELARYVEVKNADPA